MGLVLVAGCLVLVSMGIEVAATLLAPVDACEEGDGCPPGDDCGDCVHCTHRLAVPASALALVRPSLRAQSAVPELVATRSPPRAPVREILTVPRG